MYQIDHVVRYTRNDLLTLALAAIAFPAVWIGVAVVWPFWSSFYATMLGFFAACGAVYLIGEPFGDWLDRKFPSGAVIHRR